jgi:hypothetical protein
MRPRHFVVLAAAILLSGADRSGGDELAQGFRCPPDAARPWVYCFWLEGNVTREGITADLEAMRRAGVGGLLFMDGAMGNPPGPHRFMSASWRAMFRHMLAEADRLGLQVNLNNCPGWAGSGGPWNTPEQASQRVVTSETVIQGPTGFDAVLAPPPASHNFYRDIAVLACPAPAAGADGKFRRIENFDSTKSFAGVRDFAGCVPWPRTIATNPRWPVVPAAECLASARVQDLTGRMDRCGRLRWDVPRGRWLVLRIGHTVAGGGTRMAQAEAAGLDCDKLSRQSLAAHFAAMVGKLAADVGPLAGRSLVSVHVDSWESGSGNWTAGFRQEFRRRRGYDLLPYLPTLGGLVVDGLEQSERFLWDYRETVCELLLENYAGYLRELAHQKGLRLSIEAYDGTCDDLRYGGRADETMCEFWQRGCYTGMPLCDIVEEMASAAHVYGNRLLGAEAFTCWRGDFLDHPATLKPLGDWAFCAGVNRFYFSEWIMQPWPRRVPGVSFAFVGTVFHRALTWWEQSRPWHEYVARCQYLLRQGQFVADVCFLAPEGGPLRFVPPIPAADRGAIPDRPGYNFDGCPAELVLRGMKVEDGRIVLPSGMRYRLLVLPSYNAGGRPVMQVQGDYVYTECPLAKVETMTPALLRRIKELVSSGATVLGTRPLKSPGLAGFPECDRELARLADELWGAGAGYEGIGRHRLGAGRVIWGATPEEILAEARLPADFSCQPATERQAASRRGAAGAVPEHNLPLPPFRYTHRRTDDGREIYFVANKFDAVVQRTCTFRAAGRPELWRPQSGRIEPIAMYQPAPGVTRVPLRLEPYESVFVVFRPDREAFDPVISITREGQDVFAGPPAPAPLVVSRAVYGVVGDASRARNVTAKVQALVDGGQRRFAAWKLGEDDDPGPTLLKRLDVDYTLGGQLRKTAVLDGQTACLDPSPDPEPAAELRRSADGQLLLEAWRNGGYEVKTASGRTLRGQVDGLPAPRPIDGPWDLRFPAGAGAPPQVALDRLISWSRHPDPGVKYFSGTAVYHATFRVPGDAATANRAVYLDLGRVAVIAEVTLNGRGLGLAWKTPFRIEATQALRTGENVLEVRVTNLAVNRAIGDEQLPEDSERNPDGQLRAWPKWLLEGKPSPTGRLTLATYRVWKKDSPLQESGLLGPVKLYATRKVALE